MLRFSASLSFLFQELPFLERFKAAKECGFEGVEGSIPNDVDVKEVARHAKEAGVEFVALGAPSGNAKKGEKGIGALPNRKQEFKEAIDRALSYARELKCKRIGVHSGIVPSQQDYPHYISTYIENVRYAADRFAADGITLLIEPFSRRVFADYLIEKIDEAKEVIKAVNAPNVALQFDCYHVQCSEGNLTTRFLENVNLIQHVQIAGVPDRNEPSIGEINYTYLLNVIHSSSYKGWIGAEYRPATTTKDGLGWLPRS